MSQLTPCPECQRHVRKTEARCPFCEAALSLAHLPPPVLPSRRMSRAATFAFGASVVGATALASCTLEDPGGGVAVYGAPPAAGAGGEDSGVGGSAQPVYGAPAAGSPSLGGSSGNPPAGGAAGEGGAGGANPDEAGGSGGFLAVYGAPGGFGGGD